jgi:hypothetical protein
VRIGLGGNCRTAVGYYPYSDFSGSFQTAASAFLVGGEIDDQTGYTRSTGVDTWKTPMGNGTPASDGLGRAGYVANVFVKTPGGTATVANGGFAQPFSTVTSNYGVWQNPNVGNVEINLGISYYLGAPPIAPSPPPSPGGGGGAGGGGGGGGICNGGVAGNGGAGCNARCWNGHSWVVCTHTEQ